MSEEQQHQQQDKTEGHIPKMEAATIEVASVSSKDLGVSAAATAEFGDKLRNTMEEWGFAIITDLLSAEECTALEGTFVNDLRSVVEVTDGAEPPAFLEDPLKLWPTNKGEQHPFSLGKFGCSDYGLIQGQFAWNVRRHPKVVASYEAMYPGHEGKLCSCMDQIFFSTTPAEQVEDDSTRSNAWWPHTDLNRFSQPSEDYACYQGIVYIWPSGADRSTTVIYPKSHKEVYDQLMAEGKEEFTNTDSHFCMHPTKNHEALSHKLRRVAMPAGSMLLFSSRTTHQGWAGGIRLAAPVCWEPKELRDEAALRRKEMAVLKGMPTTHLAHYGLIHPCFVERDNGGDGKVILRHRGQHSSLATDPETGAVVIKPEIMSSL